MLNNVFNTPTLSHHCDHSEVSFESNHNICAFLFSFNLFQMSLFFLEYVFLADYWSGSRVFVYGTDEEMRLMGIEHKVFVLNHRYDVDWVFMWQSASRFGVVKVGGEQRNNSAPRRFLYECSLQDLHTTLIFWSNSLQTCWDFLQQRIQL